MHRIPALALVSATLTLGSLGCVARGSAPASETPTSMPTRTVVEAPPKCPKLSSEPPSLTQSDGRVHVQSSASLSCPAVVDPRGELIAVCAGDGVAAIGLDSGRELAHLPQVRRGAWGFDRSGSLLVVRDGERSVEVVRIDPRTVDLQPEARTRIELADRQRRTVGLTRYGEVVTWLSRPLSGPENLGLLRIGEPRVTATNRVHWRRLDDAQIHELPLHAQAEMLWAIDGRSYAYLVDGERRVIDSETDEVLARWTRGLLEPRGQALRLPMLGGRSRGDGRWYGRSPIAGLGRERLIYQDEKGRFWVSSPELGGEFRQRLALDEVPRHAWFEGFSPAEDAAVFRVAPVAFDPPDYDHPPDGDDELLLIDLDSGAKLAARSFVEPIDGATVVDPRCGVLVIAQGNPSWWPTDDADAPIRPLGLPRTDSSAGSMLDDLINASPEAAERRPRPKLNVDRGSCTATLERGEDPPLTLRWPDAPDGSAAEHCAEILIDPSGTRALLITRNPPGAFDRYDLPMVRPWRRLRASMFALDGKQPQRPLWTRTLPEEITAANFVDRELVVASGTVHSTLVRISVAKGRVIGRRSLPEHAAIVAFVRVAGGFVALTNDPYTKWQATKRDRNAGVLGFRGPQRSEALYLRGFDERWTERWASRIFVDHWHEIHGWFPVHDLGGSYMQTDTQGRYLIVHGGSPTALGELGEAGIRWIDVPGSVAFAPNRSALLTATSAGHIELRRLADELPLVWTLAIYADGRWIRWLGDELLEHSAGDGYRDALNRIGP